MAKTGLLAKAKAKAAKTEKAAAQATVWLVPAEDPLGHRLEELLRLKAEADAADGKIELHKESLKTFADEQLVMAIADRGAMPDLPISIQNAGGHSVAFVVQECRNEVKSGQVEQLQALLGEDAAEDLLEEATTFNLNQDLLAKPGVLSVVEKALEGAITKLLKAKTLTAEEADSLIEAKTSRVFKPKTFDRLAAICGKNSTRLAAFLKAMGSSAKRYVKV